MAVRSPEAYSNLTIRRIMHTRYPSLPGQQKKRRPSRRWRFVRRHYKLLLIIGLVFSVALLAYQKRALFLPSSDGSSSGTATLKNPNGKLEKGTPKYQTYLPAGKSIKDYGGWTRVSPPERNPVYAYADTIGKIPVIVSQQPLPEELRTNTSEMVQQLAAGYSANQKIKVKDITIYVGTSAKGPQSIIFAKGKTLILIKSTAALTSDALVKYIESLMAG